MFLAEGQDTLVFGDGTGEGAFGVAEEFRFQQGLGILGEVDRQEQGGEAGGELVFGRIEGDKAAASDGGGGGSFAGTGGAFEEGGKVLHAIPEVAFVIADVVGEDVVPQVHPQFLHAGAFADQAVVDEEKGPADLVEHREVLNGLLRREAAMDELTDGGGAEGNRQGRLAVLLGADEVIEGKGVMVIDLEEEGVFHEVGIAGVEILDAAGAVGIELVELVVNRVDGQWDDLSPVVFGFEPAGDLAVDFAAFDAEGIGEGRIGDEFEKLPVFVR